MNIEKKIFHGAWLFCIYGIVLIAGCQSKSPSVAEVIANPSNYAGQKVTWTDIVRDTVEASKDTAMFFFGNSGFCRSILKKTLKQPVTANTLITITGIFDSVRSMEVKSDEKIVFQGHIFFISNAIIRPGKKVKEVSNKN